MAAGRISFVNQQTKTNIMRNTTSPLLTLISYLIMLGTVLVLLFAAMPTTLRAQTNLPAETNLSNVPSGGAKAMQSEPTPMQWYAGPGFGNTLISIMPFVFPVAIIAVVFYTAHRRNKLAHETLRLMIEKGVPVTPELIASLNIRNKKQDGNPQIRYLLPGLILAGVGTGMIATMVGKPGLIVLLIGVAFLIVWLVERKRKSDAQPPES